jgi:hypothetical protein
VVDDDVLDAGVAIVCALPAAVIVDRIFRWGLARDERLPSHSITSLAVANNFGGKSSPSDLAVARLSTKSNFVIW